jgi:hypothetical protein
LQSLMMDSADWASAIVNNERKKRVVNMVLMSICLKCEVMQYRAWKLVKNCLITE